MDSLLTTIQRLEVELHHPGVRCDVARLQQLLHPDFHEVGRSGREYDRPTVVQVLNEEQPSPQVISDNFSLKQLSPDTVLLTYRSATRAVENCLERHTLRSSIWVRISSHWQLLYHQGTPAAEAW